MSAETAPRTGALPPLRDLPEAVRGRVVALTARVLPDVARVPPALRKVAGFAPARRARHGRSGISAALEADEEFRDHVAVQVAAIPDDDSGPVERAARAWLVRPEGALDAFEAALDEVASLSAADVATTAQVDALTERLVALQQAERDERARHKAALQKLKDDNADLRRKLGETRTAERGARERADRLADHSSAALDAAAAAAAAAEADARRLRAQVEELRATLQRGRSEGRAERDGASVRARLLLDTVLEATAGLQRELALPSAEGRPADRVEIAEAEQGVRSPVAGLAVTSPALLEQYLALPRAHLVVDGYNVSMTAWASSSLELQRTRLLSALATLVARTRIEVTVVFDAHAGGPRPVVSTPRGVRVVFSPEGVIADDVIREYVAAEPAGRVVVVATSDQQVARDVVAAGARAVAAEALVGLLRR
ncbi:MAG: NYN domain-containing protein [Nocardioides sp.]